MPSTRPEREALTHRRAPRSAVTAALHDIPALRRGNSAPWLHTLREHPELYPQITVTALRLESTLFHADPLICLHAVAAGTLRAAECGYCTAVRGYALQLPTRALPEVTGSVEHLLYADRDHPTVKVLYRDPAGQLTESHTAPHPRHADLLHGLKLIALAASTPPRLAVRQEAQ